MALTMQLILHISSCFGLCSLDHAGVDLVVHVFMTETSLAVLQMLLLHYTLLPLLSCILGSRHADMTTGENVKVCTPSSGTQTVLSMHPLCSALCF